MSPDGWCEIKYRNWDLPRWLLSQAEEELRENVKEYCCWKGPKRDTAVLLSLCNGNSKGKAAKKKHAQRPMPRPCSSDQTKLRGRISFPIHCPSCEQTLLSFLLFKDKSDTVSIQT